MGASGRLDHLRPAALDMLDQGNSLESVAQMLGVPISVLMRWRDEGPLSVPAQAGAVAVPMAVPAPARPIRFSTTPVVKPSPTLSVGYLASCTFYAVVVLAPSLEESVAPPATPGAIPR